MTPSENGRRRFKSILTTLLLLIIGLALAGGVVALWLLRSEPQFVRQQRAYVENLSPEQVTQVNRKVETQFLAALNRELDPADRTVAGDPAQRGDLFGERLFRIPLPEANTWLSTRMPEWMAQQGRPLPDEISNVMGTVEDGKIVMAFSLNTPQLTQLVSMTLDVKFEPDGQAMTKVVEIKGGRLPLPMSQLTGALKQNADAQRKKYIDNMSKYFEGERFLVTWKLDDVRQVRLLDLKVQDDVVVMRMMIEPRKNKK